MNKAAAEKVYFDNLYNIANVLINEDTPVNSAIAETNASGWGPEPAETPRFSKVSDNSFDFESEITLTGDSHEERGWCGDELTVRLQGTFKQQDGQWRLDSYDVLSVSSNFDQEIEDE
jgi:hypothetical protein